KNTDKKLYTKFTITKTSFAYLCGKYISWATYPLYIALTALDNRSIRRSIAFSG
ncbi:Hypothetical protein FKW44_013519, partial [Caligus rogercresseyi]